MLVTLSGIITLVRFVQPENADPPIPRTPVRFKLPESESIYPTAQLSTNFTPGIVAVSKREALQPENAEDPMLVTLSGIAMLVSPLQPENAQSPMLVTLPGIVTLVSPLQPENALAPMFVTLSGIVTLAN